MLSIPHGSSESWSLLCGPWSSFVVSFPLGPYSRFLVPCWPPSSGSQWPALRFPMAHPLVSNGPSSSSQWPTFRFSMAHPPALNGPSSVVPPLVISLELLAVPTLVPGPPPGLLPLLSSTLTAQSAFVLLFSFLFTPSFQVVVYISSMTCILIL